MPPPRKIDPERLDYVEGLFARGYSEREIQRRTAKRFDVTRRHARRYLTLVRARLAAALKAANPDEKRAQVAAMLEQCVRVALHGPQPSPSAAATAAARLGELHGVMEPKKFVHSGSVTVQVDPKALADELNAFLDGRSHGAGEVSAPDAGAAGGVPPAGESDGARDDRGTPGGGEEGGGGGGAG